MRLTLIGCAVVMLATSSVEAQHVSLDRFRPAPLAADGFGVDGAEALAHLQLNAALTVDYARKPLLGVLPTGREIAVVRNQATAHVGVALGLFDRLVLFAGVPVVVVMNGEVPPARVALDFPLPDAPALGDALIGARVQLVHTAPVRLALQAAVTLPSSKADDSQAYAGEGAATFLPRALLEVGDGALRARLSLGGLMRKNDVLADRVLGDELVGGLGLEYGLLDRRFRLMAETTVATAARDFGGDGLSSAEALFGFKFHAGAFYFGLAGGPGISEAIGTPAARGVVTLGIAPQVEAAPSDGDGDGIDDEADRCPTEPEDRDGFEDTDGCPDADNDGDGIADGSDRCPTEAEDVDGFEDTDGCPDGDNDGDGIADGTDKCPTAAEDTDGFEDGDGCPDPDNDGDGVLDAADKCPGEAEDRDGLADEDGCPETDFDGDKVPDTDDQCPTERGTVEAKGCLPNVKVDADKGVIQIDQRVEFDSGGDTIQPESRGVLEQIAALLSSHGELTRVRIEGHTDSTGSNASNMTLSKKRAQAVRVWLTTAGIEAGRLEAVGCGERHPLRPNKTPAGRRENRRVELHILEPAPPTPHSRSGCEQVDEAQE